MEIAIPSIGRDIDELKSCIGEKVICLTRSNVYTIHFKIKFEAVVMDSSIENTSDEDMSFGEAENFVRERLGVGK